MTNIDKLTLKTLCLALMSSWYADPQSLQIRQCPWIILWSKRDVSLATAVSFPWSDKNLEYSFLIISSNTLYTSDSSNFPCRACLGWRPVECWQMKVCRLRKDEEFGAFKKISSRPSWQEKNLLRKFASTQILSLLSTAENILEENSFSIICCCLKLILTFFCVFLVCILRRENDKH